MAESVREGLHASTWQPDGTPAAAPAEVARAARFYMVAQVENGHMCPITMTRASVAALAAAPALRGAVLPKIALPPVRPELPAVARKIRDDARHGYDREAGRHRCARQHHARRARWRCVPDHRPQVVHVGADVRRVPGAGAGGRRSELFLHAALSPGRRNQRAAFPAIERQARQPLQRVIGGGVRQRLCRPCWRGGAGHPDHPADGATDPARLRDLLSRHDARGPGAGAAPLPASQRFPETSVRPADDANGAGRHGGSRSKAHSRR